MGMETWMLIPAVFIVAALYSSVGHGGASGYLAVMALLAIPKETAVPGALLLNLVVAGLSWRSFHRAGHFRWGLVAPFLAGSVPAALLGGSLRVSVALYNALLSAALAFAAFRLIWSPSADVDARHRPPSAGLAVAAGAGLGFVSGIIGVGGGIFLSPLLLLAGWATAKPTCAASAFFILVNSAAGLAGRWPQLTANLLPGIAAPALAAFLGGTLGARLGSERLSPLSLRRVLGGVLAAASVKLLMAVL